MKSHIAGVVFNLPINKSFDYRIPKGMDVKEGMRVWAEFGRKKMVGVVARISKESKVPRLKPLLAVLDVSPALSREHCLFARKLTSEYLYSWGEWIFTMLPRVLRRKKILKMAESCVFSPQVTTQGEVFCVRRNTLNERVSIYKERVRSALTEGSVVICFPLVAYLEKAQKLFQEFSERIVVFHSYQRDRESLASWQETRKGKRLIMGTRGALFYYPEDTRLLIVEEENNSRYVHPEKPFYHLLDVAYFFSRIKRVPLLLSTDYPSLETYKKIRSGTVALDDHVKGTLPFELLRMRSFIYKKNAYQLNPLIIELVRKHLQDKKKILILYNRRGFSTYLKCTDCGYVYRCPKCWGFIKYSLKEKKGICFHCNYTEEIPSVCARCNSGYIRSYGVGIEKIESQLLRAFPSARISLFEQRAPESQIIVSTYACMENVDIFDSDIDVGFVLDSDYYLSLIDYEATFRLYLYLKRLAYRVKDKAYVVSENIRHYLWEKINLSWKKFYSQEAVLRKEAFLPPYAYCATITVRGKNKNRLLAKAGRLYNKIAECKGLEVFGPLAGIPPRVGTQYYYSVIAKSRSKLLLRKSVKKVIEVFPRGSIRIAVEIK